MLNKEDMDMARVELNEKDIEDVVGGAYNFYYDQDGAKRCDVDGFGDYKCTADARDKLTALKLQHKGEGWTTAMYVQAMLDMGKFIAD